MDAALEAEIDALEAAWRAAKPRVLGFAMGMGTFKPEVGPHDLYVLGRSPDGQLGAVMRFFWHCGRLSLDAMRRVGDTPNGLNEALVARALEAARERGAIEVSLNYAGLAHLSRVQRDGRGVARYASRATLALLGRRFQLERLVRFNDKFLPEWRPRFLVCDSPVALPRAVVRVLQAEAYLPQPQPLRLSGRLRHLPRPAARWAHPKPAG
jgi:lysyl-tRNA synthetase class 2